MIRTIKKIFQKKQFDDSFSQSNNLKLGFDLSLFMKSHTGGREVVALNLLKGFHNMGKDSDIVCFCLSEYVDIISEIGDFEIVIVPYERNWSGYTGKIGKIRREWECGIIGSQRVGKFLRDEAKKRNINIMLFADKATPIIKFPMKTAFITHDSSCFSVLEIPALDRNAHAYRKIIDRYWFKLDVKYRDITIAISDYDASIIKKYVKNSNNKIIRIYDPIMFEETIENKEPKYIVALNVQSLHKNVVTLIKAYDLIADRIPYELRLIGKRPQENLALDELMKQIIHKDKIKFTGFLSNDELKSMMEHAAIYVNPSIYEGFGMTPIEMMGNKIPAIVADNTAQREVTLDRCLYYSDALDYEELANKIMECYLNPKSKEELQVIADVMRKEYDYQHIAECYYTVLEDLLDDKLG